MTDIASEIINTLELIKMLNHQIKTDQANINERKINFWQKCMLLPQAMYEFVLVFAEYGKDFGLHYSKSVEGDFDIRFNTNLLNRLRIDIPPVLLSELQTCKFKSLGGKFIDHNLLDIHMFKNTKDHEKEVTLWESFGCQSILMDESRRVCCFNTIRWLVSIVPNIAHNIITIIYNNLKNQSDNMVQWVNKINTVAEKLEYKEI